jgi:mono/diheme cytochrome c family protein
MEEVMKHIPRLVSRYSSRSIPTAFSALWLVAACSSEGSPAADPETNAPIPPTSGVPSGTPTGAPGSTGGETNPATSAPLDPGGALPTTASSEWCQALDIFRQNCQSCHASEPQFGAPMSLTSFDDLQAAAVSDAAQTVTQRVQARIHDAQKPMPPGGMSADNVAVLDAWLASGASAGSDPTCAGLAPAPVATQPPEFAWPDDCEEFYTLKTSDAQNPAEKYVVAAGREEHPQFIFDAPWGDANVQMLAYRPITDNPRVLHHWIMYENSGGIFGGAGGGKFLVGWAPGSQGSTDMPDDVGMYMPGGAGALRLDVHYYNLGNAQAESDASGFEMCITRTPRKFTATVAGLFGNATAPVGRSDNATSCTVNLTGVENVTFLSVSPHMHQLGVHAKLGLTRAGQQSALHDAPFDFFDQRIYPLDDLAIRDGDVLTTTCSYENDTGRTVSFGQNSDDEMCFNFVTYYPMGAFQCGLAL